MIDLSKNIIYEDDDIIALDKPAGLVVHPDGRTEEPSVSGWFVEKYPGAREVGEPVKLSDGRIIERPGIVHRIDRDTSGVLLIAKTAKGFESLKEQFQSREIEKIYHLFIYGNLKDDHGTINLPIARSVSNFRKWSAEPRLRQGSVGRGGATRGELREAVTYFHVLHRAGDKSVNFVEAKPKTGRTHQIRVHFKALHHPVVCDNLYAPKKPCLLGFNRLALHARQVTFKDVGGDKHSVIAGYPEDFMEALKTLADLF